jgi:hypothetical protein
MELPPKAVFDEIIDVCCHASMLTEQSRPTVFRVVFLDSQNRVPPGDDEKVPPATRYLLKEPVPFTQGELRRLAQVAGSRRVLIAVEQSGGRLQIYGLIDICMSVVARCFMPNVSPGHKRPHEHIPGFDEVASMTHSRLMHGRLSLSLRKDQHIT